jgi:DHA2 family multidrug resistance protein-like MFS transporter
VPLEPFPALLHGFRLAADCSQVFLVLLLARYPAGGTQVALLVGVGFAMFGAALSTLRLSPSGARGAEAVRVREGQRATGE